MKADSSYMLYNIIYNEHKLHEPSSFHPFKMTFGNYFCSNKTKHSRMMQRSA